MFKEVGAVDSFLNAAAENQVLTVLATLSFVLLIVVTGGVIYLTAIEWRNKRQRIEDAKATPLRSIGKNKRK